MRKNVLGGALLGLALLAVYVWSGHIWIDVIDEGYFLDLADRVRLGAVPYRDFSTYYTPGIFYLFAAVMNVFGASILPIRYLTAGLRAAAAVLMFSLARRVAPWPWALVPVAVMVALDHWPIEPEPHPSWPAIVACLATLELVARHSATAKLRWLGLAGAMAGVSFLFKQNVGAFTALGVAGYVVLRPRVCGGRGLRLTQVLFGIALGVAMSAFLWPGLDWRSALALWVPLLLAITVATGLARAGPGANSDGLAAVMPEATAAGTGFGLVTLSWLVPLALVLGPRDTPLGLFLGAVDARGLAIAFDEPSLDRLHLYLPALAAWTAIGALAATRARGLPTWYVLFGALALLAMYPRSDTAHALVASPPILVAGAWALSRVRPRLLAVALLGVPIVAVAPQVTWRAEFLLAEPYEPLGLARAAVAVPRTTAEDTRAVVEFVRANTPPGAPLFVYPAAPLLNFLAERPNPTRFDHFFAGTLSPSDYTSAIADLDRARPQYVIWDHRGVVYWGTDLASVPLNDYVWTCYGEVAAFELYLVLERQTDRC
jgi:hypothetical protein